MGYKKLLLSAALAAMTTATALAINFSRSQGTSTPVEEKTAIRVGTMAAEGAFPNAAAKGASDHLRRPPRQPYLSLQPDAARLAHKLGRRYGTPGLEVTALTGTLTIGSEPHAVRIIRRQENHGERLEVTLDGQRTFTWTSPDGVKEAGSSASGEHRVLIERLALDGPDQFVLAQLRGASYQLLARRMRPVADSGTDGYTGPVYDVVRVTEPSRGGAARVDPAGEAASRLYHFNSETGLIEKVVSEDVGVEVSAELAEWVTKDGETLPSRIRWRRAGAVVMEFKVTGYAFGVER